MQFDRYSLFRSAAVHVAHLAFVELNNCVSFTPISANTQRRLRRTQ